MKPAANRAHEGKTRTRVGPASLLLLLLGALAPALVEASLPRAGASLLEHEEVAASRLDSSRQAAPFRSPAIAPIAPAMIGNGFTLFAGDELARASRAPGVPALAPDHAGDLALASREREERFALHQGADAFGLEPLRGPPPLSEDLCQGDDECLAGTRIGGLELEGPFFAEGRPRLSLELQWACSASSCGLADGKPLDPWGLSTDVDFEQRLERDAAAAKRQEEWCRSHPAQCRTQQTRASGALRVGTGLLQAAAVAPGCAAPEPVLTKVACWAGLALSADNVIAGGRQVWTGREQRTASNKLLTDACAGVGVAKENVAGCAAVGEVAINVATTGLARPRASGVEPAAESTAMAGPSLTPNAKGNLGRTWSRAAAEARGEAIAGEEVDLIFTIGGKRVGVRADVLSRPDGSTSYTYIESKWSGAAPYTENQVVVIPELVKSGDAGLLAEVGARAGGLRKGDIIRVQFQGDVWTKAPTLLGQ